MSVDEAALESIVIEIGAGELMDRITILQIKNERIADPAKRANIARELVALQPARTRLLQAFPALASLEAELKRINEDLWTIEDAIRQCEAHSDFGPRFIEFARAVYKNNDRRGDLKKTINVLTGARIIEEKSYSAK
jgi:CHAT domain-containing protein